MNIVHVYAIALNKLAYNMNGTNVHYCSIKYFANYSNATKISLPLRIIFTRKHIFKVK